MGVHIHINTEDGGGSGGGGGQAAQLAVAITYADLKALRDAGTLTPGAWYRITDYACTTAQGNTRSAGHAFDIIVRANSETQLNENAFAAHNENDEYFADCKLEAWELKYCIDNDTDRFAWADSQNGTGVVYRMKDEWGNDCPYDFKNILFAKEEEGGGGGPKGPTRGENDETAFYYTFSWVDDQGVINDATIVCQTLDDGEGNIYGVTGNEMKECYLNCEEKGGGVNLLGNIRSLTQGAKIYLPYNMFVNTYEDAGGNLSYGCYANKTGLNCHHNVFGTWCFCNSFGNNCVQNTFGNSCYGNSFGNGCYENSFGNGCAWNSFGNGCQNNSFGNGCQSNSFGNECYRNSFGNNVQGNTFGNDCYNNSFGNGFYDNSFGNSCYGNSFGNYFQNNSFGNECGGNSFGNEFYCSTIGNNVQNNRFGDHIRYITVFDNVSYMDVQGTVDAVNQPYIQNAQILNGTSGNGSLRALTFNENFTRTQVAGLNSSGTLLVWIPADQAGSNSPAVS